MLQESVCQRKAWVSCDLAKIASMERPYLVLRSVNTGEIRAEVLGGEVGRERKVFSLETFTCSSTMRDPCRLAEQAFSGVACACEEKHPPTPPQPSPLLSLLHIQPATMATLFCQRTTCFRSINAASRSFPLIAPIPLASFTTTSKPLKQQQRAQPSISRQLRHASTSTSTAPADLLTWDRFFALRRKRRWLNLGCSALTSVATVGIAAPLLAQQDFDSWGAQISGLDPIVVLGISTFTIAAGGWLAGPAMGNLVFSLWAGRKGWQKGITEVCCRATGKAKTKEKGRNADEWDVGRKKRASTLESSATAPMLLRLVRKTQFRITTARRLEVSRITGDG